MNLQLADPPRDSNDPRPAVSGLFQKARLLPSPLALAILLLTCLLSPADEPAASSSHGAAVKVQIFEEVKPGSEFELSGLIPVAEYTEDALGFVRFPTKYSRNALPLDRSVPFVIRATTEESLGAGDFQLRLRSRGAARLLVNDELVLSTQPQKPNSSGDDPVPPPPIPEMPSLRPPPYPHQEEIVTVHLDGKPKRFTLIAVIGGKGLVPSPGELSVSAGRPGDLPKLLGGPQAPRLTDAEWNLYASNQEARLRAQDIAARTASSAQTRAQWQQYHEKVRQWLSQSSPPTPPKSAPSSTSANPIDHFILARLESASVKPTQPLNDLEFLRRLSLDAVGLIPTPSEVERFLSDPPAERRSRAIDYYLNHPGWADHWVSYWQDVLAENPGILKPDLNNSGPFRWWLHQSLFDNIPIDRLAVELVEMEGSVYQGAPAAFKLATLNDAPLAAKADILSQAFLAEKLSCARCHDAPNAPHKQKDTFSFAAMLEGKPLALPASSTVPFVEGFRKPRVDVSLTPGQTVEPHFPFLNLAAPSEITAEVPVSPTAPATRREVAALIVSPANKRFAQVIVNRVWKRYLGAGIVEPVEDWQGTRPSHPDLLEYLAHQFVFNGCDLKAFARLIFTSDLYQRAPSPETSPAAPAAERLFAGPARRRLSAEQLVDSLFLASGKNFNCEELNLNPAGNRALREFLNLGTPRRAWEFTALMNERDRPALALPVAQSIVDVLTTFGWRQSRQNPATTREDGASPMQSLLLANGIMGTRIARLSDDSAFTELALESSNAPDLIHKTFLRLLSRPPSSAEATAALEFLQPAFNDRIVRNAPTQKTNRAGDSRVSWANHLSSEATVIRMEEERQLRLGDQPTLRLHTAFRERYEDILWSLINSPEFALIP